MRALVVTVAILTIAIPTTASADMFARCSEDQLTTTEQAVGRNAWANKCGYISENMENLANMEGLYLVFTTGSYGGSPNIPVVESANCIDGLQPLGLCMKGCYTPEQELLFDGEPLSIEKAYYLEAPSVTALTADATVGDLEFGEQPIHAFTAGETDESIFVLEGDGGQVLRVTEKHPMVLDDGTVVPARSLSPGDVLYGADGEPIELVSVKVVPYEGYVWNVEPRSEVKAENILVAEGYLTGSVRFQNEWADEVYRLLRRNDVKLPAELTAR
jgi:hypothetical protein